MSELYFMSAITVTLLALGMGMMNFLDSHNAPPQVVARRKLIGIILFPVALAMFAYKQQFMIMALICTVVAFACYVLNHLTVAPRDCGELTENTLRVKLVLSQIFILALLLAGSFGVLEYVVKYM